jgi:hypothetical protein
VTILSPPRNHWLYRQLLHFIVIEASCLAVVIWTITSSVSAKLDFLNQPAAEVLSVWLRIHDSKAILSVSRLIHIVIIPAKNSREFREVLNRQSRGSLNLQASPDTMLYPPSLNSLASEQ